MIARLFRRAARTAMGIAKRADDIASRAEDIGAWLHTAAALIGPDHEEDRRG